MPREECQKYFERENIAFTCMHCNWIGISWIMQWAFFSSIKTIWIWGSWNWRVIAIDWEFSWLGFCCPICCSRHAHISQILYIDFEPVALWFMVMQQERERQGETGKERERESADYRVSEFFCRSSPAPPGLALLSFFVLRQLVYITFN